MPETDARAPQLPTTDEIFAYVEELVALGARSTGTEAGRAAADLVAGRLREHGVPDVSIESVPSSRWVADRWGLEVAGKEVACFPVTHSFVGETELRTFSTGAGLTAPVVDLGSTWAGDADPDALRGAIVVFDLRFPEVHVDDLPAEAPLSPATLHVLRANGPLSNPYVSNLLATVEVLVAAGAAGFVGVLADYFDSNRYVNEDYGAMPIPGVWVTRRDGAALRERVAPEATATLHLEGRREAASGHSVVGVLPGRSAETILVHSHHDSVWNGAVEDASGCAVVLALARYFAAVPAEDRQRTLMFVTFDTHFTGYEAHEHFVEQHVRRLAGGREILVDVVVEHLARKGTVVDGELVVSDEPALQLLFNTTGPEALAAVERALTRNALDGVAILPTAALPTDELPTDAHFTHAAGVPVISYISGPMYLYDEADTLDKVDREQLLPVSRAFAEIVMALDRLPRATISG